MKSFSQIRRQAIPQTCIDQAHLDHLTRDKRRRVIVVDTSVAGILDFNLKPDQRATLLERGREAVLQFVQGQGEDREDPS